MREGLVGLRHSVEVVLALEGPALLLEGVEDLAGELLVHVLLAALPRERDDPANSERPGTALRHLDGHLVLRAPDAARKRGETSMPRKLAAELLEASESRGGAVKKREETHRMAEANKAFSHYRW